MSVEQYVTVDVEQAVCDALETVEDSKILIDAVADYADGLSQSEILDIAETLDDDVIEKFARFGRRLQEAMAELNA